MIKILECILNNRICRLLDRDDVLCKVQAGFRQGRSTIEHLAVIDYVFKDANRKKKKVFVAFLDISKAFDKTWSSAILQKLV